MAVAVITVAVITVASVTRPGAVIATTAMGEIERAQERRRPEVGEGGSGGDDLGTGAEDVELRSEGRCAGVEAARVEVPVAGVDAVDQRLECRHRLGRREGAVPGT